MKHNGFVKILTHLDEGKFQKLKWESYILLKYNPPFYY